MYCNRLVGKYIIPGWIPAIVATYVLLCRYTPFIKFLLHSHFEWKGCEGNKCEKRNFIISKYYYDMESPKKIINCNFSVLYSFIVLEIMYIRWFHILNSIKFFSVKSYYSVHLFFLLCGSRWHFSPSAY